MEPLTVVPMEKLPIGRLGIRLEYFIEKEAEANKKLSELTHCTLTKNFKFDTGRIGISVSQVEGDFDWLFLLEQPFHVKKTSNKEK